MPAPCEAGWVASGLGNPVCDDEMWVGIYDGHIYHGVFGIGLSALPEDAWILGAQLLLTGQNPLYLSKGGSWQLQFMVPDVDPWWPWRDYDAIHNAEVLFTVPPVLESSDLGWKVVNVFTFTPKQLSALEERLRTTRRASFRLDGPQQGANNLFSWGLGYGPDSPGQPPLLQICYVVNTPRPPTSTATPRPTTPTPELPTPTDTPRPPTVTSTSTATSRPPTVTPTPRPPTPTPEDTLTLPTAIPPTGPYPGPASTPTLPH